MQSAAQLREREDVAKQNPGRKEFSDPTDYRLEGPLGRLRVSMEISESAFQAGVRWRDIYLTYLRSIGCPTPYGSADGEIDLSDEVCEAAKVNFERGRKILESLGKRVFHAVNALTVFEDPSELGDFAFTVKAAKRGLDELSQKL